MTYDSDSGQAMPAIIPFNFDTGQPVRTLQDGDDMTWFILADVCRVLELGNPSQAARRLDEDERGIITSDTPSGEQSLLTINESGLYSLILTSRKPAARRFKKWVTAEVLPAIRKRGHYSHPAILPADLTRFDPLRPIRRGQPVYVEGTGPVERAWLEHDYLPDDRYCSPWIIGRPVKILGIAPGPNLADVWSDIEAKAASRNPPAPAPDWQGAPPRLRHA